MSHDLTQRIKEDVEKSGFPLEIEVSSTLRQDGWGEFVHDCYLDEEEKVTREIDVSGFKRTDINSPDYEFIHVSLLIKCKKRSDKPWVFFTREKGKESHFPFVLLHSLGNPRTHTKLLSQEKWMKHSHYFSPAFTKNAIISYEPFTGLNDGGIIFESSMKAIKALTYQMKETKKSFAFIKNPLFIFYPVMVLDGHLFEYTNAKAVEPVPYLQYLVRHRFTDPDTDKLVRDMFLIDVLRKEFLQEYLKILRQELNAIEKALVSWTD